MAKCGKEKMRLERAPRWATWLELAAAAQRDGGLPVEIRPLRRRRDPCYAVCLGGRPVRGIEGWTVFRDVPAASRFLHRLNIVAFSLAKDILPGVADDRCRRECWRLAGDTLQRCQRCPRSGRRV